jgi:hypothetical protein
MRFVFKYRNLKFLLGAKNRHYRNVSTKSFITTNTDLAIAHGVSRRLLTAVVRTRSHVRLCGICGGQNGTEVRFTEYFGFPCHLSFHQLLHIY